MRELRFRLYDKVCKIMTYPEQNNTFQIYLNGSVVDDEVWCTGDVILMQYTGLKDCNDKEIYEGDILGGMLGCAVVEYSNDYAGFVMNICGEINEVHFWELSQSQLEIIGNKFENPELLEGIA